MSVIILGVCVWGAVRDAVRDARILRGDKTAREGRTATFGSTETRGIINKTDFLSAFKHLLFYMICHRRPE